MKKPFRPNDRVSYGVVPGELLGIYNMHKALFLSDYPKENFLTFTELRKAERSSSDVFIFFAREKFGNSLSEADKKALKQRRFFPVMLSDLKHLESNKSDLDSMLNKRHLYLTMARHYVRTNMPDDRIHRLCEKIEQLQVEIESYNNVSPTIRDNSRTI